MRAQNLLLSSFMCFLKCLKWFEICKLLLHVIPTWVIIGGSYCNEDQVWKISLTNFYPKFFEKKTNFM